MAHAAPESSGLHAAIVASLLTQSYTANDHGISEVHAADREKQEKTSAKIKCWALITFYNKAKYLWIIIYIFVVYMYFVKIRAAT